MNQQAAWTGLRFDQTQRLGGQAIARGKSMGKIRSTAVMQEFFMKVEKLFRVQSFQLETGLIMHATVELMGFFLGSPQALSDDLLTLRQRMTLVGSNFRDCNAARTKRDDVACFANTDRRREFFLADLTFRIDVEEFRMYRSSEQAKRQFGCFGSHGARSH